MKEIRDMSVEELTIIQTSVNRRLKEIESADKLVVWNYEVMGLVSRSFTTFESALGYFEKYFATTYTELALKYEKNKNGYSSVYNNAPKLVPELMSPQEFKDCINIGYFEDLKPSE